MPTTAHVPAPWIAGEDLYPVDSLTAKQAFLREAADGKTLVFFDHDPRVSAAVLIIEGGRPRAIPQDA
jgi:hypothetical protein